MDGKRERQETEAETEGERGDREGETDVERQRRRERENQKCRIPLFSQCDYINFVKMITILKFKRTREFYASI